MPQIKFSHKYQKILNSHNDVIETATLLQVSIINLEDLSKEFLNYDTDNGVYELPKRGKYLMLIFLKEHEDYTTDLNLFTTLRRHTPEKHKFYMGQIGKVFKVMV
ncbi:MAG: hypothetical protein ABFD66_15845 [Smithella sp.]